MTIAQAEQFFTTYRDGFNAADASAVTSHYAFSCMFSQSKVPAVFAEYVDILANNEKLVANYLADGFERAEFTLHNLQSYGEQHAMADVAWTIHRTAKPPVAFRTAYALRHFDAAWKVWAVTVYEEKQAYAAAGLS